MAKLFGLSAVGLTASSAEVARGEYLQGNLATAQQLSLPSLLLSLMRVGVTRTARRWSPAGKEISSGALTVVWRELPLGS
ncbi:hypothetical protein LTR94_036603, partial [Friedmanniomyces endolithicus]